MLGYLNLLSSPPLTASGAPFHSPVPPPGCPAGTSGSPPTEGFEEASGLGHIPHPPSGQDSHSRGCQGLGAGCGGHFFPFPLPASHWTYNSGTEPGSRCPSKPVSGETSTSEPGTHTPNLKGKRLTCGHFLALSCLSLSPPPPCSVPSPYSPFPYFSQFNLLFCLHLLSLSCCPPLASPPPHPSIFSLLVIKDKR